MEQSFTLEWPHPPINLIRQASAVMRARLDRALRHLFCRAGSETGGLDLLASIVWLRHLTYIKKTR